MIHYRLLPSVDGLLARRRYKPDPRRAELFPQEKIEAYLADMSDIDLTYAVWDENSGRAGYLRARTQLPVLRFLRKLVETYFDFEAGVYRYVVSGRLVPERYLALGNLRVAKAQEIAMRSLTQDLVDGFITEDAWYSQMRGLMKQQYRASYIASIGGIDNYTRSEISRFGWQVRPQYRWLDNFLLEIQSGRQPLNGFAVRRAGMYARAGNGIYQGSRFSIAERNGKTMARRVLGATDAHCHDRRDRPGCVELADLGYVSFERCVPIGDAACYSHCLCRWVFK